ncbi:MAG: methyltransferase domain-containing protein [Oleibacter sp.]|nr:methyltransferase domain-containing protein [Thalassolituus sp.]
MANVQHHSELQAFTQSDHKVLIESASRSYANATRTNNQPMLEQAAELAFQAWQANNRYIPGINLIARIAMHRGRINEAQHWINQGLAIKPESTSLLYSAGHIALSANDLDNAEHYFEEACKISRVSTKAATFLAHVKLLKGDFLDAFQHYRELIKTHSNDPQVRSKLFEASSHIVADFYSAELENDLLRWFDFDDVDHIQLRDLTTSLLHHKLKLSEVGCPLEPEDIASDPLLLASLTRFYFCDPVIERLLLTMRQSILMSSSRNMSISNHYLPLVIALAHQCELNEAVWFINPHEKNLIDQLENLASKILKLDHLKYTDVQPILLLVMMYRPLRTSPLFEELHIHQNKADNSETHDTIVWPQDMATLMDIAFTTPYKLKELAQHIPQLGVSSNDVSEKVRAQYESHPYPRWSSLGYNQPADYYGSLQALYPGKLNDLKRPKKEIKVLVAGCGTGRHALRLARYFYHLNVTALDLSLSSLSYAQWQSQRYQLANVEFMQGDLLLVNRLGEQYDVIECSGVLHHMKDPAEGLYALLQQLKPGGLMKIALYSRQARTVVTELRQELGNNLPHTDDDIRCVRETLFQQKSDDWQAILSSSDFYSLSACRDLLFHEQEHVFDLQQIRSLIDHEGLKWIGMVPPNGAKKLAQECLQLSPDSLTLNDWHTLEQIQPSLFAGMYQFYVRKPFQSV